MTTTTSETLAPATVAEFRKARERMDALKAWVGEHHPLFPSVWLSNYEKALRALEYGEALAADDVRRAAQTVTARAERAVSTTYYATYDDGRKSPPRKRREVRRG